MTATPVISYERLKESSLQYVPAELRDAGEHWVCWRSAPAATATAKPRKIPVNPRTGQNAASDKPETWASFTAAVDRYHESAGLTGVGFVFADDMPFAGVDIDNCRNTETKELEPWALELVERFNSYTEISPSGTGVKIFIRAKLDGRKNHFEFQGHEVEVYDRGRYFAVTGRYLLSKPATVEGRQAVIDDLLPVAPPPPPPKPAVPRADDAIAKRVDEIPDDELIDKIRRSRQGEKFAALMAGSTVGYPGYFAASGALCTILAAWTRLNAERIDRIYRTSGLYEETWWSERAYKGRTRGEATIAESCTVAAAGWLYDPTSTVTTPEPWPEPEPLGEDLPAVPALDLAMLPDSLRGLVEDISDRMQTPADFAAAVAIVALAGVVGRRAQVQPKVQDSGWQVIPNLWELSVAPPGFLKSAVLAAVTAPLAHVEEMWRNEHAGEITAFESEKKTKEIMHRAWAFNADKAARKGQTLPVEPDTTLVEPTVRRLVLTDSTPEKLQEILAENPAGALVLRDELIGLIAEMDKEGREQQRAFYLQAWNGYGGYTVDRIARGTLYIPHICLSVFGNVQPARLRSYLANLLEGGPGDDGLFQRFQILVWPDARPAWKLVDRPPNNTAIARAEKVYSILANLPTDSARLRFAPDAQEFFYAWWTALEVQVRAAAGMHPSLVSHLSKYRSLFPSLAALYELADIAANGTHPERNLEISQEHARQAGLTCAYLEQHARRAYSCIVAPQMHAARELAGHIVRGVLPESFSLRDVYKRGWASLDTPEGAAGAVAVLEDAGWVRKTKAQTTPAGGRPTAKWVVNPAVKRD